MAFRFAAAPAAGQRRAWLRALALALAGGALLAAAVGLHPRRGGSAAATTWAGGLFSSSTLLQGQQAVDTASAGPQEAQQQQQQAVRGGLQPRQPAQQSGAQRPPLCGGASRVRPVADSLAASGQALLDGLDEDFRPYQQGFGLEEVEATAAFLQADAEQGHVHTWMEVHNQTVTFPRRPDKACEACDSWLHLLKASLERGMQAGRLSIPEGLPFLLNVNDASWCPVAEDDTSSCTAPLFSIFKSEYDRDIPIPNFKPEVFEPVFYPWERKREIAFFRGAPICSFPSLNGAPSSVHSGANCSRWVIAQLSWDHPELFNATLMEKVTQYGGPQWVDMPRVSHQEAAEYKYVLAVDGATAAYRFAFLMQTNSVVLKQVTDKMEWYYRAVQLCEHYLPFWVTSETDVVQLVQQLQGSPANDLVAQHIAANSQAFALTYLTEEYAFRYWQLVVDKYAALYRGPISSGGGGTQLSSRSSSQPPDDGGGGGPRDGGSSSSGTADGASGGGGAGAGLGEAGSGGSVDVAGGDGRGSSSSDGSSSGGRDDSGGAGHASGSSMEDGGHSSGFDGPAEAGHRGGEALPPDNPGDAT